MSSSCLPDPTILPSSITRMRSASRMVPTLWATTTLVDPAVPSESALLRSRSVLGSRAEKVSSNT